MRPKTIFRIVIRPLLLVSCFAVFGNLGTSKLVIGDVTNLLERVSTPEQMMSLSNEEINEIEKEVEIHLEKYLKKAERAKKFFEKFEVNNDTKNKITKLENDFKNLASPDIMTDENALVKAQKSAQNIENFIVDNNLIKKDRFEKMKEDYANKLQNLAKDVN